MDISCRLALQITTCSKGRTAGADPQYIEVVSEGGGLGHSSPEAIYIGSSIFRANLLNFNQIWSEGMGVVGVTPWRILKDIKLHLI